jgi:hypothetical protein
MSKAFTSIKQGLREAIAHQNGKAKGVKTYTPSDADVHALRQLSAALTPWLRRTALRLWRR